MADYMNPTMRGLQSIQADKFPASFEQNLAQTNQSLEFLSKVVIVMQRGIDEADDTIFDDIKQFIDEMIILLDGGTLGPDNNFQQNIEGLLLALQAWVGKIPIIGDILAFLISLFGNSLSHGSRLGAIEVKLAVGAGFVDDFNRPDNRSLITPPRAGQAWVQGGTGQNLGIIKNAARIDNGTLNAAGRRWAQAPIPASSDTMSVQVIVNDAGIMKGVYTEVYIRASANLAAFAFARIYDVGIQIGRGTKSGNTWTYATPWDKHDTYKIAEAQTIAFEGDFDPVSGKPRYTLRADSIVVCQFTDETNSHTIGEDRRLHGFSSETRAFPPFGDRFSWGIGGYYMRSEVEPSAIQAVTQQASQASSQSATAVQEAAAAAIAAAAAQQTAVGVEQIAQDAQTTANSVEGIANAAQQTANVAYQNAQYWKDECVVASAGVMLGVNELIIGVVMDVPPGRTRKITSLHFAFFQKPESISLETKVTSAAGVERVVHSITILAGVTRQSVSELDITVTDKERVSWNVTAQSGSVAANVLQVAVVGVLL